MAFPVSKLRDAIDCWYQSKHKLGMEKYINKISMTIAMRKETRFEYLKLLQYKVYIIKCIYC